MKEKEPHRAENKELRDNRGRLLPDWISSYIRYTDHSEPPLSYHTWVSLSVIAGALQRKVYMRWGHARIYPNLYVILVGPSGRTRKGYAIDIGKALLKQISRVRIVPTSITQQKLIRFMAESQAGFTDRSERVIKWQAAVTHISPELSVFMGQKNIDLLANITDWFDCDDEWKYSTKHQGEDVIKGMCYNFLGATAPDWLPSILPQEAIGGGWSSRVFFVVEDKKRKIVSNPNKVPLDTELMEMLIHDLKAINRISGEMTFDVDALAMYEEWYTREETLIQKGNPPIYDPRFGGYVSRRATHVKKLAMVVSCSRSDDLTVTEPDLKRAMSIMCATEKKMTRVFSGIGQSDIAALTHRILTYIISRGEVRRSMILRTFYHDLDAWTMDRVERSMEYMKVVKVIKIPKEGDTAYIYIGDKLEEPSDA